MHGDKREAQRSLNDSKSLLDTGISTVRSYSSDRNIRQEMTNQIATAASATAAVRSTLLSEAELYEFVEFGEYMNQPASAGPFISDAAAEAKMANTAPRVMDETTLRARFMRPSCHGAQRIAPDLSPQDSE